MYFYLLARHVHRTLLCIAFWLGQHLIPAWYNLCSDADSKKLINFGDVKESVKHYGTSNYSVLPKKGRQTCSRRDGTRTAVWIEAASTQLRRISKSCKVGRGKSLNKILVLVLLSFCLIWFDFIYFTPLQLFTKWTYHTYRRDWA